jgi:hypothetical protein
MGMKSRARKVLRPEEMATLDLIHRLCRYSTHRLFPGYEVYLVGREGDPNRFAKLFLATWHRLPSKDRRLIMGWWGRQTLGHHLDGRQVTIGPGATVLLGDELRNQDRGRLADTVGSGHTLRFDSNAVAQMPDNVVQDLVAHELAHVVQLALGFKKVVDQDGIESWRKDGRYWGTVDDLEREADEMIDRWGFDPGSLHRRLAEGDQRGG